TCRYASYCVQGATWGSVVTRSWTERFCFFFFASRRRHTRSKRDWSSDVCSSDLAEGGQGLRDAGEGPDVLRVPLGVQGALRVGHPPGVGEVDVDGDLGQGLGLHTLTMPHGPRARSRDHFVTYPFCPFDQGCRRLPAGNLP